MIADVVLLPSMLSESQVQERTVVVFDVLRATTTMAAALTAGVAEIRIFGSVGAAREAAGAFEGRRLLCGEQNCLPPGGFDLGNSPGDFSAERHHGRVVFMSTTNGTRAILAAREAAAVLAGSLVNASAVAQAAAGLRRNVTLLCAGTGGAVAMEDLLGAGAVLAQLQQLGYEAAGDAALMAGHLFQSCRAQLQEVLSITTGGRNVITAGLQRDIAFAARLDVLTAVGMVQRTGDLVRVTRMT